MGGNVPEQPTYCPNMAKFDQIWTKQFTTKFQLNDTEY